MLTIGEVTRETGYLQEPSVPTAEFFFKSKTVLRKITSIKRKNSSIIKSKDRSTIYCFQSPNISLIVLPTCIWVSVNCNRNH